MLPLVLALWFTLVIVDASFAARLLRDTFGTRNWYLVNAWLHTGFVATALLVPSYRRRSRPMRACWVMAGLYGLIVAASSLRGEPSPEAARVAQIALVPLTVLSLACALPAMLPRAGYWRLVDLLTGVMAVVSVCSVIDVIVRPAQILGLPLFSSGGRGFGLGATRLFYNPNAIGSFVQFFPALILARLALDEADGWPRPSRSPWRAAALAVISIHLALTFSRSSQLVALLSLTPLVVRVRPAVRRRLLIVAGPAAVVLGAASVLNPVLRRHAAEWLSFEGRWALWSAFGPSIRQAPILGTGLFGTYANGQTPHNVFLAQLVFFGSVGLAVFLAMMVVFARAVRAGLGRAPCVSRQLVACLLVAALGQGVVEYIVSFPLLFSNSMFWLCLGLAAAPRHPRPLGPSDPRALSALP